MYLPVFGDEGFDAVHFLLLVRLLLRAQDLLRFRLHVSLGDEHLLRDGELQTDRERRRGGKEEEAVRGMVVHRKI